MDALASILCKGSDESCRAFSLVVSGCRIPESKYGGFDIMRSKECRDVIQESQIPQQIICHSRGKTENSRMLLR